MIVQSKKLCILQSAQHWCTTNMYGCAVEFLEAADVSP